MSGQLAKSEFVKLIALADIWIAAKLLPIRVYSSDFQAVLALAESSPMNIYQGLTPQYISRCVMKATSRPWFMRDRRCLRRSIICYRYLRKSGFSPNIHFSVDQKSFAKAKSVAHCWVEMDGDEIIETELPDMARIFTHPAGLEHG
jgi:hypothetical protein